MNDDLDKFGDLYLDPSANRFFQVSGTLSRCRNIYSTGIVGSSVVEDGTGVIQIDETSQLRKLLDNLKNTEAEEYIDIVIEFLRRRLEKVLDNPDMVDSLDKLRKLDSLNLADRVLHLENEVDNLRISLSEVTAKLNKLVTILKDGQEEIRNL